MIEAQLEKRWKSIILTWTNWRYLLIYQRHRIIIFKLDLEWHREESLELSGS